MTKKTSIPEWTPPNAGKEFASRVVHGKTNTEASPQNASKPKPNIDIEEIKAGILAGNRTLLSRAITLVESNSRRHFEDARKLVNELLPHAGKSLRIGITGTPGAGKSTFIESLGLWLINQGHKVAVLAIDPSSTISKGSILGDKTRMEALSRHQNSFIRPSPSGGILGGVARKTRESIILCEAAAYDIILIETVGVGQSEITVRSMVDMFVLLQIAGAGDELQGIKKGIMELADLILVNKADGDNLMRAQIAAGELNSVLHYLQNATEGWQTKAQTCSALEGTGIQEAWDMVLSFVDHVKERGILTQRRQQQGLQWFNDMFKEALVQHFFANEANLTRYNRIVNDINQGKLSPSLALSEILLL